MSAAPVPAAVNLKDTRQPELYAATIAIYCLALLVLGARFLSRRLMKSGYGLDDWFAVTSMVGSLDSSSGKLDANGWASSCRRALWSALSCVSSTITVACRSSYHSSRASSRLWNPLRASRAHLHDTFLQKSLRWRAILPPYAVLCKILDFGILLAAFWLQRLDSAAHLFLGKSCHLMDYRSCRSSINDSLASSLTPTT